MKLDINAVAAALNLPVANQTHAYPKECETWVYVATFKKDADGKLIFDQDMDTDGNIAVLRIEELAPFCFAENPLDQPYEVEVTMIKLPESTTMEETGQNVELQKRMIDAIMDIADEGGTSIEDLAALGLRLTLTAIEMSEGRIGSVSIQYGKEKITARLAANVEHDGKAPERPLHEILAGVKGK